jgi:hypothetical protein
VTDIATLLSENLHRVFGNRDPESRRRAIAELYADDVVFVDPEETLAGVDALDRKVVSLLEQAPPTFVFQQEGPVYVAPGFGAVAWSLGPAGAPVVRGVDVITVVDGRIVELRTALAAG